ncbi:uncharacterized protein LOC143285432 isoform X2 [Babylonia areolata]|uniref:uncharacterized protein LOC143285432 isoform X2 n=1 Tax=Babylonia areolata TaxID=304850 RepID=UPI003FD087B7
MPTVLLPQLVDLALGTPEVGAVNFNVLNTLLHAMISKLGLGDVTAELSDFDRDFLSTGVRPIKTNPSENEKDRLPPSRVNVVSASDKDSAKGDDSLLDESTSETTDSKADATTHDAPEAKKTVAPYHQLENRVAEIAKALENLNALPTTHEFLIEVKGDVPSNKRAVNNMWQSMQMKKKVETNEEGIEKLTSMIEDLMVELNGLKTENEALRKSMKGIVDLDFEGLLKRLSELEKLSKDLVSKFDLLPTPEEFNQFVRWGDLEDALRGIRTELEKMAQPQERIVIAASSQTEKIESRPPSAISSRPSSARSVGPSAELLDILETLGKISTEHMNLEKRVTKLEEEMQNKLDKGALDKLSASDDLLNELNQMKKDIEALQKEIGKMDSGTFSLDPFKSKTVSASSISSSHSNFCDDNKMSQPQNKPQETFTDTPKSQQSLEMSQSQKNPQETFTDIPKSQGGFEQTRNQVESTHFQFDSDFDNAKIEYELNSAERNTDQGDTDYTGNQIKDSDAIGRLQKMLSLLEASIDKLTNTTQDLSEDSQTKGKQIEELYGLCKDLDKKKADKEYVAMEVDVKADKKQLEGKVNHNLFDSTTSEINKAIKDILDQLAGNSDEWKNMLAKLMNDLDGKLDRMELNPLKDWLEQKLKALSKKIQDGNLQWSDDEAAGLKKQLIQHYHCLSCDKPLEIMPTGVQPNLSVNQGMPPSRSPRPYTTYELDQIRQHAKSFGTPEQVDFYATSRQCGGSHTTTLPHQRFSRFTPTLSSLFRDEDPQEIVPLHKEEVDVMGADGHIYRGRVKRLEAKMSGRVAYTSGSRQIPPETFRNNSRPVSARGPGSASPIPRQPQGSRTSRPQSARVQVRTEPSEAQSGISTPPPEDTGREMSVEVPGEVINMNGE